MTRTKPELIAENALLRQQLIVLQRSVKRPKLTTSDRWLLLLSSRLRQRARLLRFRHRRLEGESSASPCWAGYIMSTTGRRNMIPPENLNGCVR